MTKHIMVVCSGNYGGISSFVKEQSESLKEYGLKLHYFIIEGKGPAGYLKNLPRFYALIHEQSFDLVHAYYGYSGLFANLQRHVPVVTSFLGSDVNMARNVPFSMLASRLSVHNIFCHKDSIKKLKLVNTKYSVVNFGFDTDFFVPMKQSEARRRLNLELHKKYILFSSFSENRVKNFPLAKDVLNLVKQQYDIELIELGGYSKEEVRDLLNAVDLLLITSKSETGPLIAKEAMACNTPIVSTDVGDVRELVGDSALCYICHFDPKDIAEKISRVLNSSGINNTRERILEFDHKIVSRKIMDVYERALSGY